MADALEELNKFLVKNDKKKSRVFREGEPVPGYAKKQVSEQFKIYQKLILDKALIKIIDNFSLSYSAQLGVPRERVYAVVLAALVHMIFIGKININSIKESI